MTCRTEHSRSGAHAPLLLTLEGSDGAVVSGYRWRPGQPSGGRVAPRVHRLAVAGR
jgi:hypothetical protein